MASPTIEQVTAALATVNDPEIRRPITELDMIKSVDVADDGRVTVGVYLTVAGCPLRDTITRDVTAAVSKITGVTGVFEAEVVNALQLTVSAHVLTQSGTYIPVNINDTGSDPVTGTATVPADCTLFIDTHGGSGANSVTITPSGATPVIGTRAAIHTDAGGQTVQVTVNDSAASLTKHLTLTLTLDTSAAGGGSGCVSSTLDPARENPRRRRAPTKANSA